MDIQERSKTKFAKCPYTAEQAAHMRMRKQQNIVKSRYSKAETWAKAHLQMTNYKWTRQAIRGWRIFDFWNHTLGIAVEIDGTEHDKNHDLIRDTENWETSRILIIRVNNFDDIGMTKALETIKLSQTWNERRLQAGFKPVK